MGIKRIRRAIRERRYEITVHALEEMDDHEKFVTVYRHRRGQHLIFEYEPPRVQISFPYQ